MGFETIISESEGQRCSRNWPQTGYPSLAEGNQHSRRRGFALHAGNGQIALMHLSNPFCDRQAQPAAGNLTARKISMIEAVKDMRRGYISERYQAISRPACAGWKNLVHVNRNTRHCGNSERNSVRGRADGPVRKSREPPQANPLAPKPHRRNSSRRGTMSTFLPTVQTPLRTLPQCPRR